MAGSALAYGTMVGAACNLPSIWPLSLVALVGIAALVAEGACTSKWRSTATVALATAGWHAAATWWVVLTVHQGDQWVLLWQAIVVSAVVAAQVMWMVAAWLVLRALAVWHDRGKLSARSAAIAWWIAFAAGDELRQMGWSGNPYGDLGIALIDVPGVRALLPLVGSQGVAWAAMGLACAIAVVTRQSLSRARAALAWSPVSAATVGIALMTLGAASLAADGFEFTHVAELSPLDIVALQPTVIGRGRWSAPVRDKAMALLTRAIQQARPGSLIVTPESYLYEPPPAQPAGLWDELLDQVDSAGVHVLLGMPFLLRGPDALLHLNAAVHLAPKRQSVYAKERPVPGGEYLPLHELLGAFYTRALDMPGPGEQAAPPELTAPLYVAGIDIGMSICHELAFGQTMAQRSQDVGLLVNLSLEGWVPSAAFRRQMLSISRARAMESGRSLLRVADNGGSMLIDPLGNIVAPTRRIGELVMFDQVQPREGHTPYQWVARWMPLFPFALAVLMAVATLVRRSLASRLIRKSPT